MGSQSDDDLCREVLVGILDILANAFASSSPIRERQDLAEAITNLRTKAERIDRPRGAAREPEETK